MTAKNITKEASKIKLVCCCSKVENKQTNKQKTKFFFNQNFIFYFLYFLSKLTKNDFNKLKKNEMNKKRNTE